MSSEAYASHLLSTFLRDHRATKGDEFSLTGMGTFTGRWFINNSEYPAFLDLLYDYLFKHRNPPIGLVEHHGPDKPFPSLSDLDFKYNPEKNLVRRFTDSHIESYVSEYAKGILRFFRRFPRDTIRFFVCLRPQPYKNKKTLEGKPVIELKDGIHIESPDLVMVGKRQRIIRLWILEQNIISKAFEGTEYINNPDEILDESLVQKNGWYPYGESKPSKKDMDVLPYLLHTVYELDTKTGDLSEMPPDEMKKQYAGSPRKLMELLSIRYNLCEEIGEVHEVRSDEDEEAAAEWRRLLIASQEPRTPIVKVAPTPVTTMDTLELTEAVAAYLNPQQTDREMNIIRRLVLECLSNTRADKYITWREVEWCLRNIDDSEDMFQLWVEFSHKSPKASSFNVDNEYREWRKGGGAAGKRGTLTKRSLHYWAREDNPAKYREIIKSDLVEWASIGRCKNTHNHVAQMMKLLYDNDYAVAMDSKRTVWYYYKANPIDPISKTKGGGWVQIVQGVQLRSKLSSEIVDIISEARTERRKWLQEQGRDGDIGNDLIVKELLALEKNLYSCPFKNSIMQEASNTFYEQDLEKKLNANTTLVGCANGVLELRSQQNGKERVQFRDAKPEDYISFMVGNNPPDLEPLEYHPFSVGDLQRMGREDRYDPNIVWDDPNIGHILAFFKMVFPREELREYVLVLDSSCLEGANREQAYYFMTGVGSNGKSKHDTLMRVTLGDYLTSLSTTAITRKRPDSGSANPDIIKIKNKRAIVMQEPDPNEPINTSRMKQFSGEDDVEARGLFQDQDTFKILGKLFMSCNKLPPIHTMDNGTWRRIRVLLFEALFVDKGDPRYNPSKNIFYKDM